jgi:hypothetical protein
LQCRVPTCDPACADGQRCVADRRNSSVTKCVTKACFAFRLALAAARASNATDLDFWRNNVTCSERCQIIKEIVRRFCLTTGAQVRRTRCAHKGLTRGCLSTDHECRRLERLQSPAGHH